MPRQPRPLVPGGIYHVTSRGNRRQEIFVDDLDRRRFLGLVANAARRYRWRCHAYCLMDNHFHLVVETPEPTISLGMYVINARHAQRFNRRHALDGHLFQDRFSSRLVETEWHLLELSRYVVLNPVRAGKCSAPGDWPWSSFRSTSGVAGQTLPHGRHDPRAVRSRERPRSRGLRDFRARRARVQATLTLWAASGDLAPGRGRKG